jgi:hypothetical protein
MRARDGEDVALDLDLDLVRLDAGDMSARDDGGQLPRQTSLAGA